MDQDEGNSGMCRQKIRKLLHGLLWSKWPLTHERTNLLSINTHSTLAGVTEQAVVSLQKCAGCRLWSSNLKQLAQTEQRFVQESLMSSKIEHFEETESHPLISIRVRVPLIVFFLVFVNNLYCFCQPHDNK